MQKKMEATSQCVASSFYLSDGFHMIIFEIFLVYKWISEIGVDDLALRTTRVILGWRIKMLPLCI